MSPTTTGSEKLTTTSSHKQTDEQPFLLTTCRYGVPLGELNSFPLRLRLIVAWCYFPLRLCLSLMMERPP